MNEIDLGPVSVALATVPTGGGKVPSNLPEYRSYGDETDTALRDLTKPAILPQGLAFLDATLFRSPIQMAIWTYADQATGRSVTLARTPLSGLKQAGEQKPIVFVPGQSLQEAEVGGARGAKVVVSEDPLWRGSRTSLVWLKGDSVLQITGRGVTEEELAETAGSV